MNPTPFSPEDMAAFEPDAKVALLATVNPDGLPHITLITSLQAKSPTELMFGQFCEGESKNHLRSNPHAGFLILNQQRQLWRGTARWTHQVREGDDYVAYNQKPMFRYNSYFGIHTVHYLDVCEFGGREKLPLLGLVGGMLLTPVARRLGRGRSEPAALKAWAVSHLNSPTTLKFLAYVGGDGFPRLVPTVPAQAAGSRRIVFARTVFSRHELETLSPGTSVALFGLNLQMESVLVRGSLRPHRGLGPVGVAAIDIDWVYNTMPPVPGQIYPPLPLEPVRVF